MPYENFALEILARAMERSGQPAFVGSSGSVSYQRFADLAVNFARHMQKCGVDRSSSVGLVARSPMVMILAVTAVALLGARCVNGARSSALGLTHVFAGLGDSDAAPYVFAENWFEAPATTASDLGEFEGNAADDDIWLVMSSSGTTGSPKHIPLRYRQAYQRIIARPDLQDGRPPVSANLFGGGSYAGFKARLNHLASGGTLVELNRWDRLVENGVNRVLGSPAQIGQLIDATPAPTRRMRSCRLAGAPATQRFVERALGYFEEVQIIYGSTEAGSVAVGGFNEQFPFDGSVGDVDPLAEVQIVDPDGGVLPAGVEGQLRLRSLGMSTEYLAEQKLTAEVFAGGWFHPGDLGRLDSNRRLWITGRVGDVVNVNGTKINAAAIDDAIQQHPAIADGLCFVEDKGGGLSTLSAIVRPHEGQAAGLASLAVFVRERVSGGKFLRQLYVADAVPRNENGKAMRREAARLAATLPRTDLQ